MIRRPPRSTPLYSSAASDVYKRQTLWRMEMKNTDISGDTRIGDIATALPASMRIFEQYGVDFCCGGDKPLAEALQGTGLSLENVRAEIDRSHHCGTPGERRPQGSSPRHTREVD